jgi:polysaccharide pyruvyl transferase WcaK-like protein
MIKILATGVKIEDNFGGPSILHGLQEVLAELYGNDYELTYYQTSPFNEYSSRDFNFKIRTVPFSYENFGFALLRNKEMKEFIREVNSSDIVVDLYGICFSDNLNSQQFSYLRMFINTAYTFRMLATAKFFHRKTVKNTCSFGPIKSKLNQKSAAFACNHLFDVVSAREAKSRDALIYDAKIKKEIFLSPDIANMMTFSNDKIFDENKIGISTSHQIIRQWKGKTGYVECIVNLCRHISQTYGISIILIPNEVQLLSDMNDITVSREIQDKLKKEGIYVDIIDSAHMSTKELKNIIASCEVIVASRYHSCVAALSSGVPTLVVGWHYKYEELLHWYGQDEWGIPTGECTSEKLISTFDSFWEKRDESKKIIAEKYPEVRKAVIETGKILFSK